VFPTALLTTLEQKAEVACRKHAAMTTPAKASPTPQEKLMLQVPLQVPQVGHRQQGGGTPMEVDEGLEVSTPCLLV